MMSHDQYESLDKEGKKNQAGSDADTLKSHAEIKANPSRHAAARDHLKNQQDSGKKALSHSNRSLRGHVKAGLSKAFPKDKTSTPFEKAGTGGNMPSTKDDGL